MRNRYESKKPAGLDVDFVVDHLLSLEDSDNFDLINKLSDLWEVYNKSWNKFSKFLPDFWKVMNDVEKLDSFDKTCKEIIEAWYDDIEDIFYSDDNPENFKLNYGFKGNDIFEIKESAKTSLKESTNDDIKNYIDNLRTYSKKDVPSYSKSYYFWSYYEFNISDNEWIKVSLSGKYYAKSLKDANNLAKSDDVVKAYLVFKNPNNPNENFKVIIKENDFYESKKSAKRSLKEKFTVNKSLKIIEHALLDLIHDDTIQEEFNMAFDDVNGIYDSVDDMFEVSVHNVLNKLLKEHTITVLPF